MTSWSIRTIAVRPGASRARAVVIDGSFGPVSDLCRFEIRNGVLGLGGWFVFGVVVSVRVWFFENRLGVG